MTWRGRHSRNYIYLDAGGYTSEFEVIHEEKSSNYGLFGIVENGYDEFYVFWRPNRNCTTDWKTVAMFEEVEVSYSNYPRKETVAYPTEEEARAAITHWDENFDYPEKRKRYRPRDSQKSKVYKWEHIMARDLGKEVPNTTGSFVKTTDLNIRREKKYLHALLSEMCERLNVDIPELKFRASGSCSWGSASQIRLLPSHCTRLVLIHEFAHTLHSYKHWGNKTADGKRHQVHGPEFVGIYMYLLIRFSGVDKKALIGHANEHNIKFLLPEQYWEWEDARNAA